MQSFWKRGLGLTSKMILSSYTDLDAGIMSWTYISTLAVSRLLLSQTRWRIPRVWNHTAAIYGLMRLFSIIICRSVIIHPRSHLAQALIISEFSLVSLLFAVEYGAWPIYTAHMSDTNRYGSSLLYDNDRTEDFYVAGGGIRKPSGV